MYTNKNNSIRHSKRPKGILLKAEDYEHRSMGLNL